MAKVLVTGGTGLIGSECARQLIRAGHEVVIFEFSPNLANIADIADQVTVVRGDVTDLSHLLMIMNKEGVDRVLHLAAFIFHEAELNPMRSVHVNAIGTGNIFDAALALGIPRVCTASTVAVLASAPTYGDRLVTEEDLPSPPHAYGATKLMTEVMGGIYRSSFGLEVVTIRPALAYGPGRLTGGTGAFNDMIRSVALGHPHVLHVFGHESNRLQPIYVKDMARAFLAGTLKEDVPHTVYNAPISEWCTVGEILEIVRELVPGAVVSAGGDRIREGWEAPMVDGSLAQRELGVVPEYSIRDGLAEMLEFYRQHAS